MYASVQEHVANRHKAKSTPEYPALRIQSYHPHEGVEFRLLEWLSKSISDHFISRNVRKENCPGQNLLSDEMPLNVNVLCTSMKLRILAQCDGALIISMDLDRRSREYVANVYFTKELGQPDGLLRGIDLSNIF